MDEFVQLRQKVDNIFIDSLLAEKSNESPISIWHCHSRWLLKRNEILRKKK